MFTEMHLNTDREFRRLDLAQKMAERRNDSLAATRRSSLIARMARKIFALIRKGEAGSTARESSEATGRA